MNVSSGQKLAHLEFASADEVFAAQGDLADNFFHVAIGPDLSRFFSLPGLDVAHLRAGAELPAEIAALPVGAIVSPCLSAAPTGWNWAAWIARRVVAHQALSSGAIPPDRVLGGDRPAPSTAGGAPLRPC